MGNSGKINRATALLLALIGVMLVLISIPAFRVFQYRAQKTACIQALKSAGDGLIIEYLNRYEEESLEDAMQTLDEVMPERPNICPAGGTVYLIKNDQGIYQPICGMHETDRKLRVRLNASRCKDLLAEALKNARDATGVEPESVEIEINGKPLECVRVGEVLPLRRGTATTNGYKGIVCYYGLEGDSTFATHKVDDGEICYFVYADEDHAAVWRADDGWTGDAYIQDSAK